MRYYYHQIKRYYCEVDFIEISKRCYCVLWQSVSQTPQVRVGIEMGVSKEVGQRDEREPILFCPSFC